MIGLDEPRETGLLLHNGRKLNYVWNPRDSLGHLLVLPRLVVKANGKCQQPIKGRTTENSDPSGMEV